MHPGRVSSFEHHKPIIRGNEGIDRAQISQRIANFAKMGIITLLQLRILEDHNAPLKEDLAKPTGSRCDFRVGDNKPLRSLFGFTSVTARVYSAIRILLFHPPAPIPAFNPVGRFLATYESTLISVQALWPWLPNFSRRSDSGEIGQIPPPAPGRRDCGNHKAAPGLREKKAKISEGRRPTFWKIHLPFASKTGRRNFSNC